MFKKTLAVITAILFSANAAFAAPQIIHVKRPPNVHTYKIEYLSGGAFGTIDLQGKIDDSAAAKIDEAFADFKAHNVKIVDIHLNSPGGQITSGSRIALDILNAESDGILVSAHVDHQELCASMCTGIFAVAQVRSTAPDTIWVFHSPYVVLTDAQKADPAIIEFVKKDQEESREALFEMYKLADPVWAEKELRKYVWDDKESELILSGAQISKHSKTYVNTNFLDQ
jgi:membrane-bound ClpP family serine protease